MPNRHRTRTALVLLTALLTAPAAGPLQARDTALLIGVSQYPGLDEDHQLLGPRNDVLLMREVLVRRGLDPAEVRILADGVPGAELPTRAAILGAIEALAGRLGAGDRLYLHLSGHASRQPQGPDAADFEPDGQDEVFLPRDTTDWEPRAGRIGNGILDNELGERIGRLTAQGVFVWLVADTCTAGTIERGVPPDAVRYRGIDPALLGVPRPIRRSGGSTQPADTWESPSFRVSVRTPPPAPAIAAPQPVGPRAPSPLVGEGRGGGSEPAPDLAAPAGGFVAFYAARAGEPEPEEQLPAGAADAHWHGLLTRRLAEALMAADPLARAVSYRRLGERILQRYADRMSPNPDFDGPGLDAPVLGPGDAGAPDRALQWPLVRTDYPTPALRIPVGRLAQIGPGSRLALLAGADQDTGSAVGYADLETAADLSAELRPVAAAGKPAPALDAIPPHAYARLVRQAIDFEVRVARPPLPADATAAERDAAGVVERLAAAPPDTGIRLRWVAPGEPALVRLGFTPRGAADCPRATAADGGTAGRLWIGAGDGGIRCRGALQSLSLDLGSGPEALQAKLVETLQRIGKVLNLTRVAGRLGGAGDNGLVKVDLHLWPSGPDGTRAPVALGPERIAAPRVGDRLRLEVTNTGDAMVDINVFFVDDRYGIKRLRATDGPELIIVEPGQSMQAIEGTISAKDGIQGSERLIVIAVERLPQQPPLDLGFLAQPTLPLVRTGADDLLDLFASAGLGSTGTRGGLDALHRRASVTIYRWRLADAGAGRWSVAVHCGLIIDGRGTLRLSTPLPGQFAALYLRQNHQRVSIPNSAKAGSQVTNGIHSSSLCAASIRSNGSRCAAA